MNLNLTKIVLSLERFWMKYEKTFYDGAIAVVLITLISYIVISSLTKIIGKELPKWLRALIPIPIGAIAFCVLRDWTLDAAAKGLLAGTVTTTAYDAILKGISKYVLKRFGIKINMGVKK